MHARSLKLHPMTARRLLRLKHEAEEEGAYRVAGRIHAVLLNNDGYTSGQIAAILKRPRSRVSQWLKDYESFGYDALLEGHRCGRPPALTPANRQMLADILDSGPLAYGYVSGVWTAVMIAQVIRQEFAVVYHPGHVCRLLHQLGFSVQRPKRKLARADDREQNRWHRYTYPNLKKTPERKAQP